MRTISLAFIFILGLQAQQPPQSAPRPEAFRPGELTEIVSLPDVPRYEYTVFDGIEDAFTGMSEKPLKLRLHTKVKFAIVRGMLYIVDDDGKIQETIYFKQAEVRKVIVPPK